MDKGNLILLIIVVVLVVAMFVISFIRKKRFNNDLTAMRNDLKIGDKVMTDTGVVGELVETYEEEGYKYFVLKSGKGNHVGYFAVHANAIYYVFGKEQKGTDGKIKSTVVEQVKVNEEKAGEGTTVDSEQNQVEETKLDGEEVKETAKPKNNKKKTNKK